MARMKRAFYFIFFIFSILGCSKNSHSDSGKNANASGAIFSLSDTNDIIYANSLDTGGHAVSLALDLYFPQNARSSDRRALILMLHGGSYLNGDKSDLHTHCRILADSGFVVVAMNYRLGWKTGSAACRGDTISELQAAYRALQDANAALRYLVAHASRYGIDVNWLFIGGNSAGSSIALNTTYISEPIASAFSATNHGSLGPINTSGNEWNSTFRIRGVCNMWGALPDSNLITAATAVPTISFHGTNDPIVPYDVGFDDSCPNDIRLFGSACIHRRLIHFNIPVISNFVIGGGHEPSVYTPEFLMSNTACFFKKIMNGIPVQSRIYTTLENSCR